MKRIIRIATRSSPLAMWQARYVAQLLTQQHPHYHTQIIPLSSSGDQDLSTPLYGMGNVGIFVKEVQQHVIDGKADIGVHSLKDLPTQSPEGLHICAICERHDVRDVLIAPCPLDELPKNATIGSSSLRRRGQLGHLRNDLKFENIRGNVGTRLQKIADGQYHATLMAAAGLKRLGIQDQVKHFALDPYTECCPAPAQGAIAVDCKSDRYDLAFLLSDIHHHDTAVAVHIERQVLAGLRGGCSLPLGCLVKRHDKHWHLFAKLCDESLQHITTVNIFGPAQSLAQRALDQML